MTITPNQDVHDHPAWTMLPSGWYLVAIGLVLVLAMVAGLRRRGHGEVDEYHLTVRYCYELRVWGLPLSVTTVMRPGTPSATRAEFLQFVSSLPNSSGRELWVTTNHWDEWAYACGGVSMAELLEVYYEKKTAGAERQAIEEVIRLSFADLAGITADGPVYWAAYWQSRRRLCTAFHAKDCANCRR